MFIACIIAVIISGMTTNIQYMYMQKAQLLQLCTGI